MTYKFTPQLGDGMLAGPGLKGLLDGGLLMIYAGPEPESAGAALDMVDLHTELVVVSDDAGAGGLTFGAASGGAIVKDSGQTWRGVAAFSGAEDAEMFLTPTFFRLCAAGDDGRAASSSPRLQGSVGVVDSGADMERLEADVASGASVPVGVFAVRLGSM